jgi:hypothetical protein
MGISYSGNKAEQHFCMTTGANPLKKSDSRGDAFFDFEGKRYYIEIKKVGSGTANQVRPCKYITLVVRDEKEKEWYVIPPHDIVDLAKNKNGQHATNSFECCNFGKKQWQQKKYKCGEQELRNKVKLAAKAGANAPPVYKKVMEQVKQDAISQKERQIKILEGRM